MRASRLLAILILLQVRLRVTAEELAREFEVSIRTIYRDIDALSAAGVPVYGDKGPGGGFRLIDGYRTRLTGLDAGEAEALPLIGLPGPAAALGFGVQMERARGKLMAALPARTAASAGRIGERFHLDTLDWYRAEDDAPFLPALTRAVLDGWQISMSYDGWRGTHDWAADPLGLVLKGGAWYLVADARGKVRTFRVGAIQSMAVLNVPAQRPPDFDLARHWAASTARFEAGLRPHRARLRLSPLGARRLMRDGAYVSRAWAEADPTDGDGWRTVDLPVEAEEQAALLLLGLGPEVEIVSPESLRQAVARLARAVGEKMETNA